MRQRAPCALTNTSQYTNITPITLRIKRIRKSCRMQMCAWVLFIVHFKSRPIIFRCYLCASHRMVNHGQNEDRSEQKRACTLRSWSRFSNGILIGRSFNFIPNQLVSFLHSAPLHLFHSYTFSAAGLFFFVFSTLQMQFVHRPWRWFIWYLATNAMKLMLLRGEKSQL